MSFLTQTLWLEKAKNRPKVQVFRLKTKQRPAISEECFLKIDALQRGSSHSCLLCVPGLCMVAVYMLIVLPR